jgi:xylulose-5-phosphate/fructose-6-phosphate phosphoketolase
MWDGDAESAPGAPRRAPPSSTAWCEQRLAEHRTDVVEHLEDMPEVRDWALGDWAETG